MLLLTVPVLLALGGGLFVLSGSKRPLTSVASVEAYLHEMSGTEVPGLQYLVVTQDEVLFEYAGGWADAGRRTPMTSHHTMMAFSMTKPLTAVAILQLAESGVISLEDELDDYVPNTPYAGQGITVRQLVTHTSGAPNPIPLRWVHLASEDTTFDEAAALNEVLAQHSELKGVPGESYAYSNIGYWLLGKVIERATGGPYVDYMATNVLTPLGLTGSELGFSIADPDRHAAGYLARYSFTNLIKAFVTDARFWGEYEMNWLRIRDHHLNGPAFGGLVGTARSFGVVLQDQLRPKSVLLGAESKDLLQTQQETNAGTPIAMTLGWHLARTDAEVSYFFKEGGGGGFHAEMRLYPQHGIGTVVMANDTDFDSTGFLNRTDAAFLSARRHP